MHGGGVCLLLLVGVSAASCARALSAPTADGPGDGAPAESGRAAGRRERCRQAAMQEMRKYQDVVHRLGLRVSSLERDLRQMYADRASQELTINQLRGNLSEQERTLQTIVEEMQRSAEQRVTAAALDAGAATEHAKDCDQVYQSGGLRYAGDYVIAIQPNSETSPFKVACEAVAGAGWIVVQRRTNGQVSFNRKWSEYRAGFGDLTGEFWLGNDKIHEITSSGDWTLRVEMEDLEGTPFWAEYERFQVDNETQRYRVHVSGYRGTAGDSLLSSRLGIDGARFSTYDRDNDGKPFENCADLFMGGWWYNECRSHLNGEYAPRELLNSVFMNHGVVWSTAQHRRGLQSVKMLLRPSHTADVAAAAAAPSPPSDERTARSVV